MELFTFLAGLLALTSLTWAAKPNRLANTACPVGWLDADDLGCFRLLEDAVNVSWLEGLQKCEAVGGYLAEPTNARKGEFLHGLALVYEAMYGIDHWWIGLSDLGEEEHWIWTHSGTPITESFWGPNSPNMSVWNTDDCGLMVVEPASFWWKDANCLATNVENKTVAPICQHRRVSQVNCPIGGEFEGNCYWYNATGVTWETAEQDCVRRGGHLTSVHSKAELDFVISLRGNSTAAPWIGGSDIVTEGKYVWTDGTAWDYEPWGSGEPDGASEDCIYVSSTGFGDYRCTDAQPFVCKL